MNTLELSSLLKSNKITGPFFCGVVPANVIFAQALQCSKKAKKGHFFLIANTDVAGDQGEHWLAFFYNRNGCLEVFDPYGLAPGAYKNMTEFFNSRKKQCTLYNKMCVQSPLSNLCGLHCVFVARLKCADWNTGLKTILQNNYLDDLDYNDCMILKSVPMFFPQLRTRRKNVINRMKKTTNCK